MASFFLLSGPPRIELDDETVIDLPYPSIDNFLQASGTNETRYKRYNTGIEKIAGKRRLRPVFRFQLCGVSPADADTIASALLQGEFTFTPRTKAASDPAAALETSYRVRVSAGIPHSDRIQNQARGRVDFNVELESIERSDAARQGMLIVTIETGNVGGPEAGSQEAFKDDSIALVTPSGQTSTLIQYLATPIRADYNPYDGRYYALLDNGEFRSCGGDGADDQLLHTFTGTPLGMVVIQDGPFTGDIYFLENAGAGDDRLYRWPIQEPAMVHLNNGFTTDMGAVDLCHNSDLDVIAIAGTLASASIRHHSMDTVEAGAVLNTTTRSGVTGITYIHGKLIYMVHHTQLKVTSAVGDEAYQDHSFFVITGPLYHDLITGRIYVHADSMTYTFLDFNPAAISLQPPTETDVGLYLYRSIAVHR